MDIIIFLCFVITEFVGLWMSYVAIKNKMKVQAKHIALIAFFIIVGFVGIVGTIPTL